MNKELVHIKRALLSVSDKSGIVAFAKGLGDHGVEIISTGGTAKALRDAGIPVKDVSDLIGFPEMMDGRVKTLHPLVHGGILGLRDEHKAAALEHNVQWIDLVVCNLYPFAATIAKPNATEDEAIENIDIGGPSMIRSAAKNVGWVGVVVDPSDYAPTLDELKKNGGLTYDTRKRLRNKAFGHTASYDAVIANYFSEKMADTLVLTYKKSSDLRYGENPHQRAAVYKDGEYLGPSLLNAKMHQGKELSYNNLNDADGALSALLEFDDPACVVVKHATPCGVASRYSITDAFRHAYEADALSAFGGVIAINRPCTKEIAEFITSVFAEVLIAPAFDAGVLDILAAKPKMRILELNFSPLLGGSQRGVRGESMVQDKRHEPARLNLRSIAGGLLVQDADTHAITRDSLKVVTATLPADDQLSDMLFAWNVVKHVRSNAIVLAKNKTTAGIGGGQVSRVDAVKIALQKAGENASGSVLASDAFFPFRDSIDEIAKFGVKAIIQPGGSIKDQDVIAVCNEHGIAMALTGVRSFKH
ncbi:MAG: bifunctional phosphoribosylaminoimidazolecarboxamide formyltransferase/IMP cyclohydrolase [Candidatus Magasanikbacteria bacterium RIFCSPHIGHO2_02_FULL_51_14]|uniref:Bifunctional purine biosynthesis protein PurH n=1 Tax=Candidatus Magasanikbacteria bacterium RIFCSPHIGHO2_02_FULL_51_14 TaxID=1798683 RepID=A0A1F6MFC9_9BACT|nr:MAG: bifunctional phosphoribosylaminoimidazolecarboxamide formyltransferase/IMP cyclohydrolase [Candidatus Magasanikbacteria bacterium RIFCSPHIGHO2_02_FULL_51_14]